MPLQSARLILVTPAPENADLHAQLASPQKMDKVHPLKDMDELMTRRLGDKQSTKRCYALVAQKPEGRDILAAIYTYWSDAPVQEPTWKMLPQHVGDILTTPSAPLKGEPTVVAFYSISAFGPDTGKTLIARLHDKFTRSANPPILTTLSPLRKFKEWLDKEGLTLQGNRDDDIQIVAKYLSGIEDKVQQFHLKNGAQIGAIHFNANAAGSLDDAHGAGCMISYRYPRQGERLTENKATLATGKPPISYHLHDYFLG